MLRMNIAPFLFRDDKPKINSDTEINSAAPITAEAIAVLTVESPTDFLIDYANKEFIGYTGNGKNSSLSHFISELDWIDEGGQLQNKLETAYRTKKMQNFIWNFSNNGKINSLNCRVNPLENATGDIIKLNIALSDYTEQKEFERQIEKYNHFDSLTNLPNKASFQKHLQKIFDNPEKINSVAIMFISSAKLQRINESYGYAFGDKVIQKISQRISDILPEGSYFARFTDGKFLCLLTDNSTINIIEEAKSAAQKIHFEFLKPLFPHDHELTVTLSIGISGGSITLHTADELIQNAHLAMQRIDKGSNQRTLIYEKELRTRAETRLKFENELKKAISNNELSLEYQPIVCLTTGRLLGFEALCRWNHRKGPISPTEFISIAEETGLIIPIGRWCIEQSCMQLKKWITENPYATNLVINVNVSNTQLEQDDIVAVTRDALAKSQLSGHNLKLEITESTIMGNADLARDILLDLKSLNITLAVDDFGTGYSSLSYLNRFPADTLKIDRCFVSQMDLNEESLKIVHIISTLASILGMNVVAEGIETEKQFETLQKMGCQAGQGYFISRPIKEEDIPKYIKNHQMKMMHNE